MTEAGWIQQDVLYASGTEGYHTFRIPALEVSTRGTLLAFAEGRQHGRGDAGEIGLVLKRSTDGGQTWGPLQRIVTDSGMTCGNPAPVVDRETGTIWLPFCKNLADGPERIHGEWWRRMGEAQAVRDYFRVEDEDGRRYWLYRRGDGARAVTGDLSWWLHGLFG